MGSNDGRFSRRDMFRLASLSALALTPQTELLAGEEPLANQTSGSALQPLNRFPRMVQEYFVSRVRDIEQAALKKKAALKTRVQAVAYVREVREKIRSCFGPFPEKTPLNARITGEVDRAIAGPGPQQVQVPQQALLPPLRMEMPSVEGRPIDPRFDLSVSNAPAAQVFMAIAPGLRSMEYRVPEAIAMNT